MQIKEVLNHDFVIVDLGSSFAKQNKFLKKFSDQITYIEIDALSNSEIGNHGLFKSIRIRKGIHVERGIKQFIERDYLACSSFLEINKDIDDTYGLEDLFREKNRVGIECVTLNDLLSEHQLDHIDFLKVDLEGLDFDILKSIEDRLENVNVIQAEIRFHPIFKGEQHFFEICRYLSDRGFEFINFSCMDEWKLNTSNRKNFRDGRIVWADFVFFRKLKENEVEFSSNLVKQILVSKSLNFNSYAEYLLERNRHMLNKELYKEMEQQINTFSWSELFFNKLFGVIGYSLFIHFVRKFFKYFYNRSRIDPKLKHLLP